ncbi:MAG TPA: inorganic phosphate transporter [Vicinamibacterales bacterium]|jgi:PiT family inorganic phosphate transporter|nr:inorganic phosphate transporter [Vicinamibacterales bacterium]
MDHNLLAILLLIAVALVFDYINGFHDAANSIATVVSTRVLTPAKAVIWAAFFNFIAALAFGTAVAQTVGAGMVDLRVVTFTVIFAGLTGAIIWDLITWYWGLPTSSSHALFGGYAGAAVAKAGFSAVIVSGWTKTLIFIVVAPIIGMSVGWLLMVASLWVFRSASPRRVDGFFRRMQLVSAACFSLMHGANDAQKTMGIISGALVTGGYLKLVDGHMPIPWWVILLAYTAIGLGTLSGGWRIIKTMGTKITKLQPIGGFSAETGAALAIYIATLLGVGISTTHTITGAIVGVGSTRRLSAVRWGIAGQIVWAWLLTIPASAVIGALTYGLVSALFGAT